MDIVTLAVVLVVVIAIVAIVLWYLRRTGIVIPEPIRIAGLAVVAILAILFVASLAGVGPRVLVW